MGSAEAPGPRGESEAQRPTAILVSCCRNCGWRGLGVQVLFGFLLSLPFTNRFTRLSPGQRDLYLASANTPIATTPTGRTGPSARNHPMAEPASRPPATTFAADDAPGSAA